MSYFLFINGIKFEIDSKSFAQTKQVNDIARLSDRQTNYTNRLKAYKTSKNIRGFENLDLPGSNSNVPYQKNECYLFDGETGECLIYKGWANVSESNTDEYDVFIYDGIIDFYKDIENRKISEIGISDLNHLKNIEGVLDSWDEDNELPYRYMIADYGGKVFTDPDNFINIDYLVPAALVKYIWDRIFDFFGYTYSGGIFNTEKFTNLYITYPKPVGSEEQVKELINTQTYNGPLTYQNAIPTEFGGLFFVTYYESTLLQSCFTDANANSVPDADSACRNFTVTEPGLFQFKLQGPLNFPNNSNGNYGIVLSRRNMITNVITYEVIIEGFTGPANINLVYPFNATPQERIGLHVSNGGQPMVLNSQFAAVPVEGNLSIELSKIIGDVVNFENAFIDFQVKDFVNEVLNHFSLTPFKDRFSRNIDFLTLNERLQTTEILNWSSKFPRKLNSKYTLTNYAQRNIFRYKYNDEQANYNDGSFSIDDKTLPDNTIVFESRMFTIEKDKTMIAGKPLNIYPIWRKEVKDNGEVQYKELENRFYFIRGEKIPNPGGLNKLGSDVFGQTGTPDYLWIESYFRLRMQEVINDNYSTMASILDKAKIKIFEFYLSAREVSDFNFKPLIYLEQWGSYYIVNKILNAQKNAPVRCELIEVDYFSEFNDAPVLNNGTYIEITDTSTDGCSVTITFDTDADLPTGIRVVATKGLIFPEVFEQVFFPSGNTITITLPSGGEWEIRLFLDVFGSSVFSNVVTIDNAAICSVEPTPVGTFITITSVQTIGVSSNNRQVRIFYDTDIPLPNSFGVIAYYPIAGSIQTFLIMSNGQGDVFLPHNNAFGQPMQWGIQLSFNNEIYSNIVNSNS